MALPPEQYHRPYRRRRWMLSWYIVLTIVLAAAWGVYAGGSDELQSGMVLGLLLLDLTLVVWLVLRQRKASVLAREGEDATALLSAGRLGEAARRFDALIRKSRGIPVLNTVFVFNRGTVFMRAGELDRAISLMSAAVESGWSQNIRAGYDPLMLSGLATAYAIKGEVESAERWIGAARRRISPAKRGTLLLAEAIIGLRRGFASEVAVSLSESWADAEAVLVGAEVKVLRLLRAFAVSQMGPMAAHETEMHQLLEGVRPYYQGEFDYLLPHWPLLRVFVTEHGFTEPSPGGAHPLDSSGGLLGVLSSKRGDRSLN